MFSERRPVQVPCGTHCSQVDRVPAQTHMLNHRPFTVLRVYFQHSVLQDGHL